MTAFVTVDTKGSLGRWSPISQLVCRFSTFVSVAIAKMGATRIHRTAITPVWTLNRPGSLNATMNVKSERIKWKDFASRSTCAAVAHLGETSQPVPVRVTWRITLVVGIALTAVSTFYSTRSFMNLSGSSEMSITSDGDSKMEHPKYHICTSNIFNLTSLEGKTGLK